MTPRRPQSLHRRLALPSLLGDGMPERLRSTSIALLGAVAAVCLGTVALVLQLGLPSVASGPLPKAPGPPAVADRIAVAERPSDGPIGDPPSHGVPTPDAGVRSPTPPPPGEAGPDPAEAVEPSEGAVLVTEPSHSQRHRPDRAEPEDDPVVVAAPDPARVEPSATSSEVPPPPVPEPAPEPPPVSAHPGNGNAYGKGNGNGVGNGGVPPGQAAKGGSAEAGE